MTVKGIAAVITGMAAIGSAIWWLGKPRFDAYILSLYQPAPVAKQCVSIPPTGHFIESAPPGEWATIEWRGIERLKECPRPDLSGIIVNGDGIFHAVDLSITGVNLDVGVTPAFRYQFRVPEGAEPGRAWFRVTLDFHEQGRSVNSPRVFFTILDPANKNGAPP
jgi:hypothetical protein